MDSNGTDAAAASWRPETWLAIGRALLDHGGAMTAGEIAAAIRKDPSNTRRAAQAMVKAGLLEKRPCQRERVAPGRKAASEFALRVSSVAALERALAETISPGLVRPGQQLVFAQADGPALQRMSDALTEAGYGPRGSWAAICDGDPHEYVMAFDGAEAVRAAVDLMSMLVAAEIRCRRVGVADLMGAHELATWSRETASRARRLRMRSDAKQIAGG